MGQRARRRWWRDGGELMATSISRSVVTKILVFPRLVRGFAPWQTNVQKRPSGRQIYAAGPASVTCRKAVRLHFSDRPTDGACFPDKEFPRKVVAKTTRRQTASYHRCNTTTPWGLCPVERPETSIL
jgi:hypothetical protein